MNVFAGGMIAPPHLAATLDNRVGGPNSISSNSAFRNPNLLNNNNNTSSNNNNSNSQNNSVSDLDSIINENIVNGFRSLKVTNSAAQSDKDYKPYTLQQFTNWMDTDITGNMLTDKAKQKCMYFVANFLFAIFHLHFTQHYKTFISLHLKKYFMYKRTVDCNTV